MVQFEEMERMKEELEGVRERDRMEDNMEDNMEEYGKVMYI